jgi:hypothetical protein
MILRTLKSNRQRNLILFPLIGILLWVKSILFPFSYDYYPGENSNVLFKIIYQPLQEFEWLQVILSLGLVIVLALGVQMLNDVFTFIRIRTKLPGSLYIIIVGGFIQLHTLHPVYLATLFFLLAIFSLFGTFEQIKPYSKIFNAGFFMGIGSLFYLNLAILLPAFIIGVFILSRESSWRGWIILSVGFLVPLIFAFSYAFLTDQTAEILSVFEKNIVTSVDHFGTNIALHVFLSIIILLTLFSSIKIIQQYDTKKVSTRKYFSIFLILFIISLLSITFIPVTSQEMLVVMAIPVTYLISNFFVFLNSRFWGELLFSLLIVIVILMQFSDKFM